MAVQYSIVIICCLSIAFSANGTSLRDDNDEAYRWLRENLEKALHRRQMMASQEEVCSQNPADLVFILDESTSIWNPHFLEQLDFVNDVIDTFRIGPDYTRIGVMTFSDTTNNNILHLGELLDNPDEMKKKISSINQRTGNTRTDKALSDMRKIEFRYDRIRQGVPHIGVMITDGRSDDSKQTLREAERVHDAEITMFAVGVGDRVDLKELNAIATSPEYVFRADSYEALDKLKDQLAWKACDVTTKAPDTPRPTTTTTTTTTTPMPTTTTRRPSNIDGCDGHKPLDVLFGAPDEAGIHDTDLTLTFIEQVIDTLKISPTQAMVGLTPRHCMDLPSISLDEYDVKSPLLSAVRRRKLTSTAVSSQLEMMMAGFTEENGGRPESKKFGILILDNTSEDPDYAERMAEQAKDRGVTLITVGVGEYVDSREVRRLASSKKHAFLVPSYGDLDSKLAEAIKDLLCKGIL